MKQNNKSKYDTGKIPITQIEREIIERQNREKYEQIIKKQQQTYEPISKIQNREPDKKAEGKRQRKSNFSRFILAVILIFAIISGSAFGYIYSLCSKTNYTQSDNTISLNTTNLQNKIYNVLLIGVDEEDNGNSRSDTMMLLTINKKKEQFQLTSFMRDLWVEIPGHESGRLNSAYTIGGADLLLKTISHNFDIQIDNYLLVDFKMFKKLIDGVGGVTVDITESEAKFINSTTHATVKPGTNTLNGDYALIYCRIRKLDSDFMRTQRQRKVISSLFEQIKNTNIFELARISSDILPLITTDISPLKMTFKLFSATGTLTYSTEQIRLPSDGTYKNKTINSQAVLVPDIEENIDILHNFIF